MQSEGDVFKSLSIGYAISNRSKCRTCREYIILHGIRWGLNFTTDTGRNMTSYYHNHCFVAYVLPDLARRNIVETTDSISGFSVLTELDKIHVKELLSASGSDQ